MEATSSSSVTQDRLNEHCMLHIFSFLPAKDLIRIERVCKRWQIFSLMSPKKITITNSEVDFLEQILEKHGSNLIELKIEFSEIQFEQILEMINKYCPKLLHLEIAVQKFFNNLFVKKFPFLHYLKSLTILVYVFDYTYQCDEKIILENVNFLLDNNYYLEKLVIVSYGQKSSGVFVNHKRIKIHNFKQQNLNLEQLFQGFLKFSKNNKSDSIGVSVCDVPEFYLKNLIHISNMLTSLKLNTMLHDCFEGDEYRILEFNNLKTLKFVSVDYVSPRVIWFFVLNCPLLEIVILSGCDINEEESYLHIGNFKELKILDVSSKSITSNILESLSASCSKLQEIHCTTLEDLSAAKLTNIVILSPNLKYMKIVGFKNLTKNCFKFVLEVVQQRENGVGLRMEFYEPLEKNLVGQYMLKEKRKDKNSSEVSNNFTITLYLPLEPEIAAEKVQYSRKEYYVERSDGPLMLDPPAHSIMAWGGDPLYSYKTGFLIGS